MPHIRTTSDGLRHGLNQSTSVPKMSCSLKRRYSLSAASLTSSPPYSGSRTVSPSFRATGISLPSLSRSPGPTATTFPELSCLVVSGRRIPPGVFLGCINFSTSTRFSDGIRRFLLSLSSLSLCLLLPSPSPRARERSHARAARRSERGEVGGGGGGGHGGGPLEVEG
uniref:Pco066521 n=1 Tax=Arundo donax TaxID=35708 RepID=A0A0A9CGF3_ARUDO